MAFTFNQIPNRIQLAPVPARASFLSQLRSYIMSRVNENARSEYVTGKVTPSTKAALLAAADGKPVAELVNDIITAYLATQKAA